MVYLFRQILELCGVRIFFPFTMHAIKWRLKQWNGAKEIRVETSKYEGKILKKKFGFDHLGFQLNKSFKKVLPCFFNKWIGKKEYKFFSKKTKQNFPFWQDACGRPWKMVSGCKTNFSAFERSFRLCVCVCFGEIHHFRNLSKMEFFYNAYQNHNELKHG